MGKRRATVLAAAAMLLMAGLVGSIWQSDLIGWWRGEARYKGRYTNSWRTELRQYDYVGRFPFSHGVAASWDLIYERRSSAWEQWLAKTFPNLYSLDADSPPPLQAGDVEAIPVLLKLLHAPEWNVRLLAIDGLRACQGCCDEEITELLALLEDEHPMVVKTAKWALWDIARIAWEDTLPSDDETVYGKLR
jgi:hypothetical protein